jgi:hypothetical protein
MAVGHAFLDFGALLSLHGINFYIYHRLVYETKIARVQLRQSAPQQFLTVLTDRTVSLALSELLYGDEWQLDAPILKWGNFYSSGNCAVKITPLPFSRFLAETVPP